MKYVLLILLVFAIYRVNADIYMHNPRGSNNRQDESGRNRANANRLFDSQNNARGGYNVGSFAGAMYYHSGSQLRIQWAHQHSCGDQNNFCNIVIQYMCDDNLKDGTTTRKPPVVCRNEQCDTDQKHGHHESLNFYEDCSVRQRNKGVFTADRKLKGDTAVYTRQNNNGNRYGFECPEERDYYPYFGHSPWKDIVVFTNDKKTCDIVAKHSQNVRSRWVCTYSDDDWDELRGKILRIKIKEPLLYRDEESCRQASFKFNGKTYQPIWKEIPGHGIEAPECLPEPWSRDNHQGNTIGGEFVEYNWTIPDIGPSSCALRIRYNISTNDFPPWETDHTSNTDVRNRNLGPTEIWNYGFTGEKDRGDAKKEALRRQYFLKNNPLLDVFNLSKNKRKFRLKLALNTAQLGRTFQDRSHSFEIVPRPEDLPDDAKIYNLNVRGKRGNIVQVFPSTEYDFVPNILRAEVDDFVHIQWTGSDNNPPNNAGQGKAKTDRSNIVHLKLRPYVKGYLGNNLTLGTNYPRYIYNSDLLGASEEDLIRLALSADDDEYKPGETLNKAEAYFDLGLLPAHAPGTYHYFSTRNNNFSNRDQKATIIVN